MVAPHVSAGFAQGTKINQAAAAATEPLSPLAGLRGLPGFQDPGLTPRATLFGRSAAGKAKQQS